jgi:hypothetical protein
VGARAPIHVRDGDGHLRFTRKPAALTVDPGDTFTEMMRELLESVDGKTRGLPQDRFEMQRCSEAGLVVGRDQPRA